MSTFDPVSEAWRAVCSSLLRPLDHERRTESSVRALSNEKSKSCGKAPRCTTSVTSLTDALGFVAESQPMASDAMRFNSLLNASSMSVTCSCQSCVCCPSVRASLAVAAPFATPSSIYWIDSLVLMRAVRSASASPERRRQRDEALTPQDTGAAGPSREGTGGPRRGGTCGQAVKR